MKVGNLAVTQELLMSIFKYEGGVIGDVIINPEDKTVIFTIFHPDMPEVVEGMNTPFVQPYYVSNEHYSRINVPEN